MILDRRNLLSGKDKYFLGMILLLLSSAICAVYSIMDTALIPCKKDILLRKIGHKRLLQWSDSASRVLPIKKIAENEHLIGSEHELTFQTDLLVNTGLGTPDLCWRMLFRKYVCIPCDIISVRRSCCRKVCHQKRK